MKFSLSQMLFAVTSVSIALSVLVWIAQHSPAALVYALFFTFPIGFYGMGIIIFAAAMYFSIHASSCNDDRKLSIAKCTNLALIGALMTAVPVLIAFVTFLFLPIMRTG